MKIAIVTGASSGLGKEFVKQVAGYYTKLDEIWVIARRTERLEILAEDIGKNNGMRIRPIGLDLTLSEDIQTLSDMLEQEMPEVRFLINCAGFGKVGEFAQLTEEQQLGMIRLNCEALTSITYRVLPHMPGNSRIIEIASVAAFLPQPRFAVYAASKSYVYSFARALNEELRVRNISVTAVCPGPTKTEFFDIAEQTGATASYKKLFYYNAEDVVWQALRDSAGGKNDSVYGTPMKLLKVASRFLPQNLLIHLMAKFY